MWKFWHVCDMTGVPIFAKICKHWPLWLSQHYVKTSSFSTSMHSSRMRTTRWVDVSWGVCIGGSAGGVCLGGSASGGSASGGLPTGGFYVRGVCPARGSGARCGSWLCRVEGGAPTMGGGSAQPGWSLHPGCLHPGGLSIQGRSASRGVCYPRVY